jgi:hypothetical protein
MDDQFPPGGPTPSPAHDADLPDLYEVRITGSREAIAQVLRQFELDVGCRHPHVEANPDRTATVLVYATEQRVRELEANGYKAEKGENISAVGRSRQAEVGKGDRFDGGRQAPRGLGEKGRGERPKGPSS